jgi:hypothetical protein
MTSAMHISPLPSMAGTASIPSQRGRFNPGGLHIVSRQRLVGDAIGVFTLTVLNMALEGALRIERGDGSYGDYQKTIETYGFLELPVYTQGLASNNLLIKIRNALHPPFYKPYETRLTAFVGAQSIYISQILD